MSRTRILCTTCGFPQCFCKCGTICQTPAYEQVADRTVQADGSFQWSVATTPDPYGWGIITTAKHCQHRKDDACTCPFTPEGRKCSRDGCPMLPTNYKELFHV